MLICVSSIRGRVGVSSWTLLLGGAWPSGADRVVVEADVAGGTAAARYGLTPDPGISSLLFDCRLRPESGVDPARHGRRLADGFWCVPGPESTEQAWPIWNAGAEALAGLLADDERVWLLDCGRLIPSGPIGPLVRSADAHVVVADRTDETMVAIPDRIGSLAGSGRVVIALTGRGGRSAREVRAFTGCESVWELPNSRRLAELAADGLRSGPRQRSKVWRTAAVLAAELAEGDVGSTDRPSDRPAGSADRTSDRPAPGHLVMRPPDPPSWTYWDRPGSTDGAEPASKQPEIEGAKGV